MAISDAIFKDIGLGFTEYDASVIPGKGGYDDFTVLALEEAQRDIILGGYT